MITLEQSQNGKTVKTTDGALDIILTALEHEMERYNQAADLVSDTTAREAINEARQKVRATHRQLCRLIYDPEADQ